MRVGNLALYGTVGVSVEKNMEQKDFVFFSSFVMCKVFSNHLSTSLFIMEWQSKTSTCHCLTLKLNCSLGVLLQNTELRSEYLDPMFSLKSSVERTLVVLNTIS